MNVQEGFDFLALPDNEKLQAYALASDGLIAWRDHSTKVSTQLNDMIKERTKTMPQTDRTQTAEEVLAEMALVGKPLQILVIVLLCTVIAMQAWMMMHPHLGS